MIVENSDSSSVQAGQTKLIHQQSRVDYTYHYCFLIPSNQLANSINWLKARLNIVEIEPGRIVQRFESWNADSVYFYDGSGNLAEFIVRYDLKNEGAGKFDLFNLLCVNEIGMPVSNGKRHE
ncbi:MAG: catechol-2,3-dioxygenase [Saprospiraceae bacterium]